MTFGEELKTDNMKKTYKVSICGKEVELPFTRTKAIKAYCTDCSVGQINEIRECPCTSCPLYPFRGFVKFNGEKRVFTEEEKEITRERLRKNRFHREK